VTWLPPPPPPPAGYTVGLHGMTQYGKSSAAETWRRTWRGPTVLLTPHPHKQPGTVVQLRDLRRPELWRQLAAAEPGTPAAWWIIPWQGRRPRQLATMALALLEAVEASGLPALVILEEAGQYGRDERLGTAATRVSHWLGGALVLVAQRRVMFAPNTRAQCRRLYFFHTEDLDELEKLRREKPRLDVDALPTLAPGQWRFVDSSGAAGASPDAPTAPVITLRRAGQPALRKAA